MDGGRWTWSEEDKKRYDRSGLRYPNDLTDAEWALVERHIPPAKRGGRKRKVDVQDRDGAAFVLDKRTRRRFSFVEVVFADQGYQGPNAAAAVAKTGKWTFEIVRREPGTKGFAVLPKRWIVERILSWIRLARRRRNRRIARDLEHLARSAEAFIKIAMIKIMLRRLVR